MSSVDMEVVKEFTKELNSILEVKPPISKAKVQSITKSALKGIKFYKHIVMNIEKFIQKCKAEYKVPGLYVIDSVVRQSRHQHGAEKDVFGPRFLRNIETTFQNLTKCSPDDHAKILRVLHLWERNNVFPPEQLQRLVQISTNAHNVATDTNTTVADHEEPSLESAESISDTAQKMHQLQQLQETLLRAQAHAFHNRGNVNIDSSLLTQIQDLTSQLLKAQQQPNSSRAVTATTSASENANEQKVEKMLFDKKVLDFDYGSEDDEHTNVSAPSATKSSATSDEPPLPKSTTFQASEPSLQTVTAPTTAIVAPVPSFLPPCINGPVLPPCFPLPPPHGGRFPHPAQFGIPPQHMPFLQIPIGQPAQLPQLPHQILPQNFSQAPLHQPPLLPQHLPVQQPAHLIQSPEIRPEQQQQVATQPQQQQQAPSVHQQPPPELVFQSKSDQSQNPAHNVGHYDTDRSTHEFSNIQTSNSNSEMNARSRKRAASGSPFVEPNSLLCSDTSGKFSVEDIDDQRSSLEYDNANQTKQDEDERDMDLRSSSPTPHSRSRNRSRSRSERRSRSHERRERQRRPYDRRNRRSRSRDSRRHRSRSKSRLREKRDKDRERRRRGLPPFKEGYLASELEIKEQLKSFGEIVEIHMVPPRGCAYVCFAERRHAARCLERMKDIKINGNLVKIAWATNIGVKDKKKYWEGDVGCTYIPFSEIEDLNVEELKKLGEGGFIDEESLPDNLLIAYNAAESTQAESKIEGAQSGSPPPPPPPVMPPPPPLQSVQMMPALVTPQPFISVQSHSVQLIPRNPVSPITLIAPSMTRPAPHIVRRVMTTIQPPAPAGQFQPTPSVATSDAKVAPNDVSSTPPSSVPPASIGNNPPPHRGVALLPTPPASFAIQPRFPPVRHQPPNFPPNLNNDAEPRDNSQFPPPPVHSNFNAQLMNRPLLMNRNRPDSRPLLRSAPPHPQNFRQQVPLEEQQYHDGPNQFTPHSQFRHRMPQQMHAYHPHNRGNFRSLSPRSFRGEMQNQRNYMRPMRFEASSNERGRAHMRSHMPNSFRFPPRFENKMHTSSSYYNKGTPPPPTNEWRDEPLLTNKPFKTSFEKNENSAADM